MVNMVDKPIGNTGPWLLQNDYQNKRTDGMALSTAEWLVQFGTDGGGVTGGSTIAGDAGYGASGFIELLKWEARGSRDVRGLSSGQMLSSASIKHSHVEVHIPIGDYSTSLETKMYNATNIDTITFVRLGNFAGEQMKEIQNIQFNNCQVVYFEQSGDILILSFRFTDKVNAFTSYDQTGTPTGDTVSSTSNFTTGEAADA